MSKTLTLTGVSILVVALVLGMAIPAMAAPKAPHFVDDLEGALLRGEVVSIDGQEFIIQSEEEEITIAVDDDTRYYQMSVPGVSVQNRQRLQIREHAGYGWGWGRQNQVRAAVFVHTQLGLHRWAAPIGRASLFGLCWLRGFCPFGSRAEFADMAVGDRVVVLVDESNLARVVLIIKPAAYIKVSGTVTDISASFITVDSDDGPQVTLSYDEDTVFVLSGAAQLEEGQYVRITYESLEGKALKIVVCPQAS